MKHDRLIALVDVFLHEGRKTADELAERFEVSVRTVYRDIDALCRAGVPVVSYSGIGGGYELEESYRIDRSFLSKEEITDLTGLLRGFSEAVKDRNLERSLGKIASLGPRGGLRGEAGRLPPPLIATLSPWGAPGPDPDTVTGLRRAIDARRTVSFRYTDAEGRESSRTVEPFSLVIASSSWYLHAWCRSRNAFRLFKLSRLAGPLSIGEPYDPLLRLPVPEPMAGGDEPVLDVVLSVEPQAVPLVLESFPEAREEPDGPDSGRLFRVRSPVGTWLVRFLLYLGPGVRILHPDSLREEYAAAAREMAEANKTC